MKKIKQIDAGISVILYISLLVWCALRPDLENVIKSYLIMGGWQVLSMIVHELNKWFTSPRGTRRIYHWISLVSLVTIPLGSYWILTFASPFMAAFYIYLCYREIYEKMQRPLAVLK